VEPWPHTKYKKKDPPLLGFHQLFGKQKHRAGESNSGGGKKKCQDVSAPWHFLLIEPFRL